MKDYYKSLGLTRNASSAEVLNAYRKLSKKFHPDLNDGDKFFEEMFKETLEAYEVLSNTEKRKVYDNKYISYFADVNEFGSGDISEEEFIEGQLPVIEFLAYYTKLNFTSLCTDLYRQDERMPVYDELIKNLFDGIFTLYSKLYNRNYVEKYTKIAVDFLDRYHGLNYSDLSKFRAEEDSLELIDELLTEIIESFDPEFKGALLDALVVMKPSLDMISTFLIVKDLIGINIKENCSPNTIRFIEHEEMVKRLADKRERKLHEKVQSKVIEENAKKNEVIQKKKEDQYYFGTLIKQFREKSNREDLFISPDTSSHKLNSFIVNIKDELGLVIKNEDLAFCQLDSSEEFSDGIACTRFVIIRSSFTKKSDNYVIPFSQINSFVVKDKILKISLKDGNSRDINTKKETVEFISNYLEWLL